MFRRAAGVPVLAKVDREAMVRGRATWVWLVFFGRCYLFGMWVRFAVPFWAGALKGNRRDTNVWRFPHFETNDQFSGLVQKEGRRRTIFGVTPEQLGISVFLRVSL